MDWGGLVMDEMTIRRAGREQNLLVWSKRVADCRSSGLSVNRWCAEHDIKPKTYYNWQKKVFAAMIERQKTRAEVPETPSRFAELPTPLPVPVPASASEAEPGQKNSLIASIRVGNASLDIYVGADAEVVATLCQVLNHAE